MKKRIISFALVFSLIMSMAAFTPASATDNTVGDADSASRQTYCGLTEHIHAYECFERELICDIDLDHVHSDDCVEKTWLCGFSNDGHEHNSHCSFEEKLVCGIDTETEHTHGEACYARKLYCGLEESTGHVHTDSCFAADGTVTCTLQTEAHTHAVSCYNLDCTETEHKHIESCYDASTSPVGDADPASRLSTTDDGDTDNGDDTADANDANSTDATGNTDAPVDEQRDGGSPSPTDGETNTTEVEDTVAEEYSDFSLLPEETGLTADELYAAILAAETLETIVDLINENTDAALTLTAEQVAALETKANELYAAGDDEDYHNNVMESVTAIRETQSLLDEDSEHAASYDNVDRTGWTVFTGQTVLVDGSKYYLTSDVEVTEMVNVYGTATLDLNGFALIAHAKSGNYYCRTITVNPSANLTIVDSNPNNIHYGTLQYVETMTDWELTSISGSNYLGSYTADTKYREKAGLWTYSGNNATSGVAIKGGIITGGKGQWHGGTILNMGQLTMTGGTIVGGYAMSDSGPTHEGYGGGGGIMGLGDSSVTKLEGTATIAYCMTKYYGGGIVCWGGASLEMSGDSSVYGCYSNIGGGVFVDGCRIGLKGSDYYAWLGPTYSTTNGSIFTLNSGKIYDCVAGQGGGGLYLWYHAHLIMNGGEISSNYSPNDAAGVGVSVGTSDIVMNNGSVLNNRADGHGGGVQTIGGDFTMNNGVIKGNSAGKEGGGIVCAEWTAGNNPNSGDIDIGKVIIKGGLIEDNHTEGNGGAFYVVGQVEMSGGTVKNCSAANGGLFYIGSPSWEDKFGTASINLSGGTIENCSATKSGGAAYVNAGTITMTGGTISNCSAADNGGAFYITEGTIGKTDGTSRTIEGEFIMSGTATLQSCSADNGGAVYINSGSVTMSGGSALNCEADISGGAFYVTGGDITMTGGLIDGNMAKNGGGAYLDGGSFTMISGSMTKNGTVAGTEYGGAVCVNSGDITIGVKDCGGSSVNENHTIEYTNLTHPTLLENNATFGGGLAVSGGNAYIYCGTIKTNHSDNAGTGMNIYMDGGNLTHDMDSSDIGEVEANGEENHGIVCVGGSMNIVTETTTLKVSLNYHSNNKDVLGAEVVWQGEAPDNYWLNLPWCPDDWENAMKDKGYTFVGWTETAEDGTADSIRKKPDYFPIGENFLVDHEYDSVVYDKESGTYTMHLYAVWAPFTNAITYAYSLGSVTTSENIMDLNNQWSGVILQNNVNGVNIFANVDASTIPTSYQFTATTTEVDVPTPSVPGYTFVGWKMHSRTTKISNWSADAYDISAGTTLDQATNLNQMNLKWYGLSYNWTGKVQQNFGDITLVAVFVPEVRYKIVDSIDEATAMIQLNNSSTTDVSSVTEVIVNGDAAVGAKVTANQKYRIMGWFYDEECVQAVPDTWVTNIGTTDNVTASTIVPKLISGETAWEGGTTFYVKVDYAVADLTIEKKISGDETPDQTFLFNVVGEGVDLYVTVEGNKSVTIKELLVGNYTVTEVTDWSWRYTPDGAEKTVAMDGADRTVTFTNSRSSDLWQDSESFARNIFKG